MDKIMIFVCVLMQVILISEAQPPNLAALFGLAGFGESPEMPTSGGSGSCPYQPHADRRKFTQVVNSRLITQDCAPGTEYVQSKCSCDNIPKRGRNGGHRPGSNPRHEAAAFGGGGNVNPLLSALMSQLGGAFGSPTPRAPAPAPPMRDRSPMNTNQLNSIRQKVTSGIRPDQTIAVKERRKTPSPSSNNVKYELSPNSGLTSVIDPSLLPDVLPPEILQILEGMTNEQVSRNIKNSGNKQAPRNTGLPAEVQKMLDRAANPPTKKPNTKTRPPTQRPLPRRPHTKTPLSRQPPTKGPLIRRLPTKGPLILRRPTKTPLSRRQPTPLPRRPPTIIPPTWSPPARKQTPPKQSSPLDLAGIKLPPGGLPADVLKMLQQSVQPRRTSGGKSGNSNNSRQRISKVSPATPKPVRRPTQTRRGVQPPRRKPTPTSATGARQDPLAGLMAKIAGNRRQQKPQTPSRYPTNKPRTDPLAALLGSSVQASRGTSRGTNRAPSSSSRRSSSRVPAAAPSRINGGSAGANPLAALMAGMGGASGSASTGGSPDINTLMAMGGSSNDIAAMILGLNGGVNSGNPAVNPASLPGHAPGRVVDMTNFFNAQGIIQGPTALNGAGANNINYLKLQQLDRQGVLDIGDLTPMGLIAANAHYG